LLDDAYFLAGSQMHESADAAGKFSIRVWDASWVVSNEKAELELWVVI
jgi:hypothetical protein